MAAVAAWFDGLASFAPGLAVLQLKALAILGGAWLLQRLWRRRSAAVRHGIWAMALVAILVFPVLGIWLPGISVPAPEVLTTPPDRVEAVAPASDEAVGSPAAATRAEHPLEGEIPAVAAAFDEQATRRAAVGRRAIDGESSAGARPGTDMDPWTLLLALWAVVAALRLGWLALEVVRARTVTSYARPVSDGRTLGEAERTARDLGIRRRVRVLESEKVGLPLTWGVGRPVVVLPTAARAWPDARLRVVLLHEFTHVRRYDYLVQLMAELACAVYWPNPLAWVARRRVQAEQEQACDDEVVRRGTRSLDYAEHLLEVAKTFYGSRWNLGASVSFARELSLKARVRAILDERADRGPLASRSGTLVLVLLAAFALPVTLLHADADADAVVDRRAADAAGTDDGDRFDFGDGLWLAGADDAPWGTPADRVSERELPRGDWLIAGTGAAGEPVRTDPDAARPGSAEPAGESEPVDARDDADRASADADAAAPVGDATDRTSEARSTAEGANRDGDAADGPPAVGRPDVVRQDGEAAEGAASGPAFVWLEAEHGDVSGAMRRRTASSASSGEYVSVPRRIDDGNGAVEYRFDVRRAGEYIVWGRVRAPDRDANSFRVALDAGSEMIWDLPTSRRSRWSDGPGDWAWTPLTAREADGERGDALVLALDSGIHSLHVHGREAGADLDGLVITDDPSYRPRGVPPIAPPAVPVRVWLEAESAELSGPFTTRRDRRAADRRYVRVHGRAESRDRPPSDGAATFRIDVPRGGTYLAWARTRVDGSSEDSFWVRVNGGDWIRWNGIERDDDWRWSPVHDSDRADVTATFQLREGENTIEFGYREGGIRIDRVLVTNDPADEPRGRGPRGDTIVVDGE